MKYPNQTLRYRASERSIYLNLAKLVSSLVVGFSLSSCGQAESAPDTSTCKIGERVVSLSEGNDKSDLNMGVKVDLTEQGNVNIKVPRGLRSAKSSDGDQAVIVSDPETGCYMEMARNEHSGDSDQGTVEIRTRTILN